MIGVVGDADAVLSGDPDAKPVAVAAGQDESGAHALDHLFDDVDMGAVHGDLAFDDAGHEMQVHLRPRLLAAVGGRHVCVSFAV
ncbi:MAG TPA: hypothetical protein DIW51_08865 [Rhodospirillaceae bacterium]|nr:hypothetical protein [Rhodospirillaceae bacterium]HCS70065.1 hypothetical protein [Rhodospirillaceae bacterium]